MNLQVKDKFINELKEMELYESLVMYLNDPFSEAGTNNLRDLTLAYYNEGARTPDQVYNILYMIGVSKEKAKMAVQEYIKNNNSEMTFEENLNLNGRIDSLLENIEKYKTNSTHHTSNFTAGYVEKICERYKAQLVSKGANHPILAQGLIRELNAYNWVSVVKEAIEDIQGFLMENYTSTVGHNMVAQMTKSRYANTYTKAIDNLSTLLKENNEEGVRKAINEGQLDSYAWISEIKLLISENAKVQQKLPNTKEAELIKRYSPMLKEGEGHVFFLSGQAYTINEDGQFNSIHPNKLENTALFLTLISVTESLKFGENTITFFKGDTEFKIDLNEGKKLVVNERTYEFENGEELRAFLFNTRKFNMNENDLMTAYCAVYENAESFTELDFVQSIVNRNNPELTVNVLKMNENIYLNTINTAMNENKWVVPESASKAVQMVKEYINYDITPTVVELLEGEEKENAILEEKKKEINDKILFINEKREEISKSLTGQELNEADTFLANEIKTLQGELNEIVA